MKNKVPTIERCGSFDPELCIVVCLHDEARVITACIDLMRCIQKKTNREKKDPGYGHNTQRLYSPSTVAEETSH